MIQCSDELNTENNILKDGLFHTVFVGHAGEQHFELFQQAYNPLQRYCDSVRFFIV